MNKYYFSFELWLLDYPFHTEIDTLWIIYPALFLDQDQTKAILCGNKLFQFNPHFVSTPFPTIFQFLTPPPIPRRNLRELATPLFMGAAPPGLYKQKLVEVSHMGIKGGLSLVNHIVD